MTRQYDINLRIYERDAEMAMVDFSTFATPLAFYKYIDKSYIFMPDEQREVVAHMLYEKYKENDDD